jgi:tripartite-type tricarboxylate transporter receptor subunit TctC
LRHARSAPAFLRRFARVVQREYGTTMKASLRRRYEFSTAIAGAAGALMNGLVLAQQFPVKAVRMVAPFAAGGGSDISARRLAERLNATWKQAVVVQNIAGGAGNVAAATVASSEPDGYTLFFASLPILVTNPVLYANLPFDAGRDFAPVVLLAENPNVLLVAAASPASSLRELITLAKANPGRLNFGSGGQGTSLHLAGELLKSLAGIDIVHIPYKGAAPAITAMLGDEIQMMFDNVASAAGQTRGGRVRGLAIASRTRATALPDVPTFDEGGIANFYTGVPHGIFVRAGTAASLVAAINRAINAIIAEPEYRRQNAAVGTILMGGTPQELTAYLAAEKQKWLPLIARQRIKAY